MLRNPKHTRTIATRTTAMAAALLLAGCGEEPVLPGIEVSSPSTVVAQTASTEAPSETPTTTILPGTELTDRPVEGSQLTVFGIPFGETAALYELPDTSFDVVATVAPLSEEPAIRVLGDARTVTGGRWWLVDVGGVEAWANTMNFGTLGPPEEILEEVLEATGPIPPRDLEALGSIIARSRFPEGARFTFTFPGEPQGLDQVSGSIIVDVMNVRTDTTRGERLVIAADIFRINGGAAVRRTDVNSILRYPLCNSGVVDDACV